MINEYIVKYIIGREVAELHISAHDEKEARTLCEMQAHHRHGGNGKVKILSVRGEGEEDPFEKELDRFRTS